MHEPHDKAPGLAAGVSEEMIRNLVTTFYDRVRQDAMLGPVFEARIQSWDEHLQKLCDFWSSVVLMTGRYKGRPMPVHARIDSLADAHFEAWLALFRRTANDVCPPAAAALFCDRAERIGQSLRSGITIHRQGLSALAAVAKPSFSGNAKQ